ncbi:DoxX family protein [Corynebacterium falsenii]|uniref:DoxX family protein n=1 Tax=Corynebacterium falsenii TaxID=108486 RepID=UPI003FD6053F
MTTLTSRANYLLAATLAGDALLSLKPPKFIRKCLDGVGFPRSWWWSLIGIKTLAATGLSYGTAARNPSITTTVSTGVVSYFLFAIAAHLRARFLSSEFWLNCLGMTTFSTLVLAANASISRP